MAKSGIEARRKAALEEGGAAYIARREEIILAAAQVFRERGFDAATLRDIADALNTDRASDGCRPRWLSLFKWLVSRPRRMALALM